MSYLLRDTVEEKKEELYNLLSVLNRIHQYSLIDADLKIVLGFLKRDFSLSIFNITTYLIRHKL